MIRAALFGPSPWLFVKTDGLFAALVVVIPGPRHLDGVDVEAADGEGGPDGGHQRPGVHPGVPQVYHQVVVQTLGR